MATKRKATPAEKNALRAEKNLRVRVETMRKKIERETAQEIEIDVDDFLYKYINATQRNGTKKNTRKRRMSSEAMDALRGDALLKRLERYSMVHFVNPETGADIDVTLTHYNKVLKGVKKAQDLADKHESGREIKAPNVKMSPSGFIAYENFIGKAQKQEYWDESDERFVANFMQSLSVLGTDSRAYLAIERKIKKMGRKRTIRILRDTVNDLPKQLMSYYFSSEQGMVYDRLGDVLDAFDIKHNENEMELWKMTEQEYKQHKKNRSGMDFDEIDFTDDEIEDIFG